MIATMTENYSLKLIDDTQIVKIIDESFNLHTSESVIKLCLDLMKTNSFTKLALNLENVNSINTSGIGSLLSIYFTANCNKIKFVLYNVIPEVQSVLHITMVDTVLNIVDTEQSAIVF